MFYHFKWLALKGLKLKLKLPLKIFFKKMHVSRVTHKGRGDSPELVERKGKIKGGHFWHKGRGQEDIILCK